MILQFVAIDKDSQYRDFSCQPASLEAACDIVSTIAANGNVMLEVWLREDEHGISLPPELFDGQSFSEPMLALEGQWRAVLALPLRSERPAGDTDLARRQVSLFEGKIGQFVRTIGQLEQLQQRASRTMAPGPARTECMQHYEALLGRYRRYVDRTQASRQGVIDRLEHTGH